MNRQVPEKIAIVGNGKVARHMMHYFASIGQPYTHWFRQTKTSQLTQSKDLGKLSKLARFKYKLSSLFHAEQSFEAHLRTIKTVLILISDDQIKPFIAQHPYLIKKQLVHFSGSLQINEAVGCHPLMTFGPDLYDQEHYARMPFVLEEGVNFKSLFPFLLNPVYHIKLEDKVRYHAYCVMAGNFSQMMWQAIEQEMQALNLPANLMSEYLLQNTKNFVQNPEFSATGPFARGDIETIGKHQQALIGHPLADVYQAFYQLNLKQERSVKRSAL